jgi:cell wall-associated NlpC family hydrolase/N-acetylmuramoyl-L-alanine amidase
MRLTRRAVCTLVGVLIFLAVFATASGSVFATTFYSTNTSTSVGTAAGNAITLSGKAYPSGAPAAVVASADSWTRSMGASVLAGVYGGPLLLSSSTSASTAVITELRRLNPAEVYVVGLSATVASQIDAALASMSARPLVVALNGADIYETAVLVARQIKVKLGAISRVVIVPPDYSGGVLAGAAMAAANGWPILLTPAAGPFSQVSADAITELGATTGICLGTTVTPSIPGFTVEETLTGTVSSSDTDGRMSLCVKVAEYAVSQGYLSYDHVGMVEAYDRLGGQVLSAYVSGDKGVLLLSPSTSLSGTSSALLKSHGREVTQLDIIGLPWARVREIKSLNAPRVTAVSPGSGPVAGGAQVVVTGTGMDTASSVIIGKTVVPEGDWQADSSTQLTIASTPQVAGAGSAELIVTNYWNRSPATVKDVYRYVDGSPALPGEKVVSEALKYLGTPYVWAGASPTGGFDCSGFSMYVYGKLGVTLPHYSRYQASYGTAVSKDQLLPGDLVFFSNPVSHVGIYVGGGLMINAPRSGDLVTIENVYRSSYNTARRILSPYTRYQSNDTRVTALGSWGTSAATTASGGSFSWLNSPGLATIKFNGSYLGWIGKKAPQYGKAKVTLDGGTPVTVDLYSASAKFQQTIWSTGLLSVGEHTVTIEWTGEKNASAIASYVGIDAYDLIGSLVQAPGPTRYQQNDALLTYTGSWWTGYSSSASGASFRYAGSPAKVTIAFDGTYMAWVAKKSRVYGKAKVTTDGRAPVIVDLYSRTALYKQKVYNTGLLAAGPHTVTIEWTGAKNPSAIGNYVNLDAVDILAGSTGGTTLPPGPTVTRYEQTDPLLGYVGSWLTSGNGSASAGDFTFANNQSKLIVGFKGTSLSWIAKKSAVYGIAKVTLDDKTPVDVDLYSASTLYQQSVYQTGELTDGTHTLTIEWTGEKNSAATDYNVGADAFDIQGQLVQAPGPVKYEQDASEIAYAGTWQPIGSGESASGGSAVYTNTAGSSATISFDGTYIAWITKTHPAHGKAKLFLDGAAPVTVDLYSSTELWKQRVWNSGLLTPGTHTLTIQWSWGRNKSSTGTYMSLDAVEILGTLTQATATVEHSPAQVVMIDPGHQLYANNALEPVGPGSTTLKAKVSGGTASVNTGSPESALVLSVGLKLRDSLQSHGLDVLMTRETQSVDVSNAQRAQMANSAAADLFVRIHADGSTDPSVNGILMLYPATTAGWTDDIAPASLRGGTIAQQELIKATGAKDRGLSARSDLAGFNWSDVPTFLTEMGLMTNPTEDALLATDAYQNKLVSGLTKGILCFLEIY